jgi:tetratricopeptide (TPR) repeat protein
MKKIKIIAAVIAIAGLCAPMQAQDLTPGKKLIERERLAEAESFFKSELGKDPKNADACFYLGKIKAIQKEKNGAKEYFQKGLTLDNGSALNLAGLAVLSAIDKDANASEALTDAVDEDMNAKTEVLVNIAELYVVFGEKDVALPKKLLEETAKQEKKNPAVSAALGSLMLSVNDPTSAISNFQTAVDYDKANYKAFTGRCVIYSRIKDFQGAESAFNSAIAADSLYSPAYREAAEMYYLMKQYDKAVSNYKKYMELSDASAEKRSRLAVLLYSAGDYKGVASFINSLKAEEKTPSIKRILALSYYYADDSANGPAAFADYIRSADKASITANDYGYYAKLLAKSGADSLAIQNYKSAINLDSTDYDFHGELAVIYFKKKMWDNCAVEYEKKIELLGKASKQPGVQDYFDLGKAYYYDSLYVQADTTFSMLVAKIPNSPVGYFWKARTKSNFDPESEQGLAKPFYEKYIELAQGEPEKNKRDLIEAYCYLGYYYYLMKDNTTSIDYWNKVAALDPENAQAKEALKSLK